MEMIVFDLETTGLDPHVNGAVTISALHVPSGDSFNVLVKPADCVVVEDEALKVTGLDIDNIMKNGIPEKDACSQFQTFVKEHGGALAACNGPFDVGFLKVLYERNKMECPVDHRLVDLQSVALLYAEKVSGIETWPHGRGGEPLLNLNVISAAFGKSRVSDLHAGDEDVKLTAECLIDGIKKLEPVLSEPFKPGTKLIFVDAITSGQDPKKHSALALRAQTTSGEVFEEFIQPRDGTYAHRPTMEAHGLSIDDVRESGRHPKDVMRDLNVFLRRQGPHILAGKNVSHAVSFIDATCREYGIRPPFGGKRFDLQTVAFIAHCHGKITLPSDKNGRPDLSWEGIARACGETRVQSREGDLRLCVELFGRLGGISSSGHAQTDEDRKTPETKPLSKSERITNKTNPDKTAARGGVS